MSAPSPQSPPAWLANLPSEEVRRLDTRKHALIEASAGTGKTFAIEHLVLRLLMENPDAKPEEILLLSFTEKTAGELRDRIRALLRRQLRAPEPGDGAAGQPVAGWSAADLARIHDLWLRADDLAVHTLHGFCQSSLIRDPIANNALIRAEVMDDRALADAALENLLRGAWAGDPDRLARLRGALDIGAGERWRDKLVKVALAWHPWRGDWLDPERDTGGVETLEREAEEAVRTLFGAIAAVEQSSCDPAGFRGSFKNTKTAQEQLRKHAFNKVFLKAEAWRTEAPASTPETGIVLAFFGKAFTKASPAVKNGWESCIPDEAAGLPEWTRLAAVCGTLRGLGPRLEIARRLRRLGLLAEAARELRAELADEKVRRGVISYDDMPKNLVEAIRRNPDLAARLRRRYKACIVDEFQDTDPVQWEILGALCLQGVPGGTDAGGESPLPLFLVGDPKQAIYGFRGGDLRTYLAARSAFRTMAAQGRAQGFGLEANFRSRQPLIDALNAVFAHAGWFGSAAESGREGVWRLPEARDGVTFTNATAGRNDPGTAGPAVHWRDFGTMEGAEPGKPPGKAAVERAVRHWIAARIVEAIRPVEQGGAGRAPGDIAVLVRKNAEGQAVERLLRRCGVPCRVRRRGGLFHGPAADALRLLLEWVGDAADPDAQARILLLPFARRDASELPRGRPAQCPPLLAKWAELARAGRWPEFFDSVLHEGGYRDRLAAVSESDAQRASRLARLLAEAGSAPGTSARALRDRFDALRRGEGEDEEDGEASQDGDKNTAVSIMTLHMSKGLEFPVAFVAASGEGAKPDFFVLRERDAATNTTGFRIALDKEDADAKARHEEESRDEDKRLFYVAFTRAREELWIPLLPPRFAGSAPGPLGGFAGDALRDAADAEVSEGAKRGGNHAALFHRDEDPVREIALDREADHGPTGEAPAADRGALIAAARDAFDRKRRLTSYSSLAHHAGNRAGERQAPEPLLEDDGRRVRREDPEVDAVGRTDDDSGYSPPAPELPGISAEELPPGAAAGTALHALLEQTPFASARASESPEAWLGLPGNRARVEEALRREAVDPAHAPAAGRAVWNTLRMPLPDPADAAAPPFRLADLAPEDCRHEVEFLLPFGSDGRTGGDDGRLPGGIARRGSYLWGFIDLVFRRDGRYYLLDWKSNLLDAYDDASVRRSMEHHRYHLQWKLYAVALDRWLGARLPGYEPERHFGGVHYLYLRGAAPDRFSGFLNRPTLKELREDFPAEIAALLGAAGEGFA